MIHRVLLTVFSTLIGLPIVAAVPGKPRVLLIGDSILIDDTLETTRLLADKAQGKHHLGNAQDTRSGLKHLRTWLKDGHFDVIHFNWGRVEGGAAALATQVAESVRKALEG